MFFFVCLYTAFRYYILNLMEKTPPQQIPFTYRQYYLRMAESCPPKRNNLSLVGVDFKQECTSPSPTETVCLENLSIDSVPGPSQLLDASGDDLTNLDSNDKIETKSEFLSELGLEECDGDCEEHSWNNIFQEEIDNAVRSIIDERKRKLDLQNGHPCKKMLPDKKATELSNKAQSEIQNVVVPSPPIQSEIPSSNNQSVVTTPVGDKMKTIRAVIPTKDNPPPELGEWITQFQRWSNAERLLAIDELITRCEPTQVRHMMQVIEPQFQRDFISLLPRELALSVLRLLEPADLLRAAQTCRSWRFLADDNLLWKEKCKQVGIEDIPKRKMSPRCPNSHTSPWKAAYMRHHAIEMNWRSRPIKPPKMLKGHDDHVITCLQFCGNHIVSGSDDNTLKVWSATTGKCLRTLVGHTGGVWSSQMSGSIIISGSTDRTLKVWDAETGVCIHTLYGHTSTVRCMHLHKDKVVSGSRDATLRVWNIETGECLHVLVGHLAAVRCVQYDGKLVVSGAYDYMVKVWNPEREECIHTLQGHTNRVYSLQFDGVHVVSGSLDTSIRVWEVESGACRHTLMGHQSLTSGMELRNNILVSGNADSTVKVWDIITGQCLQTLSGPYKHQSAVTCLQFNNRFVITSSDDGTVKLWDLKTGEFIRNLVALDSGGSGGVVWRIRASDTKLVCAVGSRNGTEETKLLVLDFDVDSNSSTVICR
ncbi:F-box/WD repeat-containing protein 7-like isoform X2 [Agrilus planipennis]|uniref:F-box/WD repeat-containing protein 7-like isoform X2 n=2 Tax=Agrilus planipennis TaxID=224129 RepID=A0A7F5RBF3_AGRPL|nr:F-box/WD repeat-containing protein 7-like isoform X2 [Agrilus planipennis]